MTHIHFILTGGTLDSYYDTTKDTVVPLKDSAVPAFIKNLKLYHKTKFTQVCMKDSRDLNKKDIQKILKTVESSKIGNIIIVHGTYTLPDTARFLKAKMKSKKVVILTASMIPLTGFSPSDAPFNLGFSVSALEYLEPGVYACVNGRVFDPDDISKIISEGRFASLFTK